MDLHGLQGGGEGGRMRSKRRRKRRKQGKREGKMENAKVIIIIGNISDMMKYDILPFSLTFLIYLSFGLHFGCNDHSHSKYFIS